MRIDERELFKSVMMGFMLDEDPMLAIVKMDHRTAYADRGRDKSRSK